MIPAEFDERLAALLALPGLTDLLINGKDQVWVQRGSAPLEAVASPFQNEDDLAELAQSLVASGGRHLDQANPFADVSIGSRFRVHAALASACNKATHISIRVHQQREWGLAELRSIGMFGNQEYALLRHILATRQHFLIAGAAGSGKTTLLRAMLAECRAERIIVLEDVAELGLQSGHLVALQTRQANVEGRGEITLDRLVREALRMRPDRIAVGEVRGSELGVMLQALNTGHTGAGATIHANSFGSVSERLSLIGRQMGLSADEGLAQARAAIHWVIFVDRSNSARHIQRIGRFGDE